MEKQIEELFPHIVLTLIMALLIGIFVIDLIAISLGWRANRTMSRRVMIKSGAYAGKHGNIVSVPWIGNGYNTKAQVNVPLENQIVVVPMWYWDYTKL